MKIAVIGAGVAGLNAAHKLKDIHDVTLFEKEARLGGHSNTKVIDYDGHRIAVDTGFIIFNVHTYPGLMQLFGELKLPIDKTLMGFSLEHQGRGISWSSEVPFGLFAQPQNLFSPRFIRMLLSVLYFFNTARGHIRSRNYADLTLDQYIRKLGYGRAFADDFLLPMCAAIWTTPVEQVKTFPVQDILEFWDGHQLLGIFQAQWLTLHNRSAEYVERLRQSLGPRIKSACPVHEVRRMAEGVRVTHAGGEESFDQVVFACHADQALAVLKTPSAAEHDILQHFPYRPSTAILHRDAAQMPKNRAAWTSWNYLGAANDPRGDAAQVSVTYWMNRLQTIDVKYPLFVSVNPLTPVAKDKIFETIAYEHPQFSAASFRAQERLNMIEGADRIWYCGAWCGFGFHEDGLISGWEVAERLGAHIDWPKGVRRRLFRTAA